MIHQSQAGWIFDSIFVYAYYKDQLKKLPTNYDPPFNPKYTWTHFIEGSPI